MAELYLCETGHGLYTVHASSATCPSSSCHTRIVCCMEFPQTVLDSISGTKQDTHTVDVVSGG